MEISITTTEPTERTFYAFCSLTDWKSVDVGTAVKIPYREPDLKLKTELAVREGSTLYIQFHDEKTAEEPGFYTGFVTKVTEPKLGQTQYSVELDVEHEKTITVDTDQP